jgi:hypothetical protein
MSGQRFRRTRRDGVGAQGSDPATDQQDRPDPVAEATNALANISVRLYEAGLYEAGDLVQETQRALIRRYPEAAHRPHGGPGAGASPSGP